MLEEIFKPKRFLQYCLKMIEPMEQTFTCLGITGFNRTFMFVCIVFSKPLLYPSLPISRLKPADCLTCFIIFAQSFCASC